MSYDGYSPWSKDKPWPIEGSQTWKKPEPSLGNIPKQRWNWGREMHVSLLFLPRSLLLIFGISEAYIFCVLNKKTCQTYDLKARFGLQSYVIWGVGIYLAPEEQEIQRQGLPLKSGLWSPTGDVCQQQGVTDSCVNIWTQHCCHVSIWSVIQI